MAKIDAPDEAAPGTTTSDEQTRDEQEQQEAPRFSIHPYHGKKQPSLYDEPVKALIDAQQQADANGDIDPETGKPLIIAMSILVPSDKKGRGRHLRDFREAATRNGHTARIRTETVRPDGSLEIEFTIGPLVTRDRKPKNGADTPTE